MRLALLALLVPAGALADTVALDDAPRAITDAIAKVDFEHARRGETLVIATIPAGDPAKPVDLGPLRRALAGSKLTILDDHTYGTTQVLVVGGARGARAMIRVDQGGGTITLTAKPRVAKLPGKCVAVPHVERRVLVRHSAIDQTGRHRQGETVFEHETTRIHDVDGDAIPDMFVPVVRTKHACPEEVAYRVYAMRGRCGHDLGVVGPGNFQHDAATVALDASGFRPFTMEATHSGFGKRGIPELTTIVRRFAIKRGKYLVADIKRSTGKCHHCATWHCTAAP